MVTPGYPQRLGIWRGRGYFFRNRRVTGWFQIVAQVPFDLFTMKVFSFAILSLTASAAAADLSPQQTAFFEGKVRPLLAKHCYECHSAKSEKIKGGLLLDSKDGWSKGGDSGEAIEPGKPKDSLVYESVLHTNPDLQMPPKYKLSDAEIDILEDWISMGAPDPRTQPVVAAAKPSGIDWEKAKNHWSLQPVKKPVAPAVKDAAWAKDDLDKFILAKIEAAGIKPAPDADRFALIRRVTFDLTGLPPTVDEVGAFVRDPASDDAALAKVVDRLLKSPAFGERWGRHWLDVARYADSVGKTRNVPFPYAWRYRNYAIDAFNADKPYNEFLTEQIAGDLLPAKNEADRAENLVATGFLALGSMDLNERDGEIFMLDRIDDQMDTLGRATMGLTLGCARCHDHKFDPIAQTDYYAMAGIFASTATLSGQANRQGGNKNYLQASLLAKLGDQPAAPQTEAKPATSPAPAKPTGANQAEIAKLRARMQEIQAEGRKKNTAKTRREELRKEYAELRRKLEKLDAGGAVVAAKASAAKKGKKPQDAPENLDPEAPLAMSATEGKISDLALRVRGEPDIKGDTVPRGFPAVLKHPKSPSLSGEDSGRMELAQWLTSREHPLTARVMANRVWAHLMGRGLVETVDNFGASGAAPTHPELLDHLATRFMDGNWSVKSLIRSIVLSHSYRLSSQQVPANVAADEANGLYWRANLRRLEAEAIRDSLLAAGGTLKLTRPEGSPYDGRVGGDLSRPNGRAGGDGIASPVRSVYLPVFRSRLPGMFTVFDFAEPDQVNGQRDVTTVPPQALFLLNNDFVVDVAKRSASRILEQELPDEAARVRYAYAYILCRYPTEPETQRALTFVNEGDPKDRIANWAALTQALYSSAEFRYLH